MSPSPKFFFLPWFNKHIAASICSILRFPSATFPFPYLGVLISPKRIAVASFTPTVDKICRTYARLKLSHLSPTAKTTLINSSILSIPTYYLSVYPIHDSILSEISKLVREFFWYKGSNRKCIHAVAWNHITDTKPERVWQLKILLLLSMLLWPKMYSNF